MRRTLAIGLAITVLLTGGCSIWDKMTGKKTEAPPPTQAPVAAPTQAPAQESAEAEVLAPAEEPLEEPAVEPAGNLSQTLFFFNLQLALKVLFHKKLYFTH